MATLPFNEKSATAILPLQLTSLCA